MDSRGNLKFFQKEEEEKIENKSEGWGHIHVDSQRNLEFLQKSTKKRANVEDTYIRL